MLVEGCQRARREGDLDTARGALREATELCRVVLGSRGGAGGGGREAPAFEQRRALLASWRCSWQHAKLTWLEGGERRADALIIAKRLRAELDRSVDTGGGGGWGGCSSGSQRGGSSAGGALEVASLRARLLTAEGTWTDTLRTEGRQACEDLLIHASNTAAELTPKATGKAIVALGSFHERQAAALERETSSSSFAKFRSVRLWAMAQLRAARRELADLPSISKSRRTQLESYASRSRLAYDLGAVYL